MTGFLHDLGNILVKLFYAVKRKKNVLNPLAKGTRLLKQLQMPRVKNHCGHPVSMLVVHSGSFDEFYYQFKYD